MHGADGWLLRWSPEVLFPELGADGTLRLDAANQPIPTYDQEVVEAYRPDLEAGHDDADGD